MSWSAHRAAEIVAERYQLLAEIGSGGMGAVWRARDIVDGHIVALKVLHEDVSDYESARERFLREAKALHSLRSPHIVQVFDSGVDAGVPFIAMELLAGETLAHRLKRTTRLTIAEVRDVVSQVAEGIGAAHAIGIVHRDLKPDNIFLATCEGPVVAKILDFGIAKARASDVPIRTLTRSGALVGTPHYMSPEQIDGKEPDWRADLWALAVITFESLIGIRPFHSSALARLCMAICDDPVPVPSEYQIVPPGFDDWFRTAVARNRDERFQSARQFAEELRALLHPTATTTMRAETPQHNCPRTLLCLAIDDEPRLIQHLGTDYSIVSDRVNALVEEVMRPRGAIAVERARTFLFRSATNAIEAAIALQRGMEAERWPRDYAVSLQLALGDVVNAPTAVGVAEGDVSRMQALSRVAHGGQVLLTDSLAYSIDTRAISGVTLEDLGEHDVDPGLKEHVFQLGGRGLNAHFAPLKTRDGIANNLPRETTEFFGRAEDIRAIEGLMLDHRIVTLRGPGGVGKSRLAARVAATAGRRARDGTFLVPLAAVRDPRLVVATMASVLGVAEQGGRSTIETLIEYLAPREMLLALDSFEHVLQAATELRHVLEAAPDIRVLVTSRSALDVEGERVYDVGPFDLPGAAASPEELVQSDAVQLLLSRAGRDNVDFSLTAENAAAIGDIVRHLDGLPLAIELAAARLHEISAAELARQIAHQQVQLHDTSGGVTRRHRTMRDVVQWSYNLLDAAERTLLRRVAVFEAGFTRELAAEATAMDGLELDVDEGISILQDSSLLQRQTRTHWARFTMFESVREFALAELEKSGEASATRQRHARAIRRLVSGLAPALKRQGAVAARDLLALEDGNLRAALSHCLTTNDGELGLSIASSAWRYWHSVGRPHEGRRWLVELLACPGSTLATRARGLEALAGLAYWQGDYTVAAARYGEALEIFRALGDRVAVAEILFALSTTATWSGESKNGEALAQDALAIFNEVGAREQVGMVRMAQGFARWMQHDLAGARPLWEESVEIAREVGDHVEAAHKMLAMASITFVEGRVHDAIREAVDAMEELFRHHNVALTTMAIDFIASMLVAGEPSMAARLSGAATQLRGTMGGGMHPEACGLPTVATIAAERLGARGYRQAFEEGRRMDLHRAIDLARGLCKCEEQPC